MRANGMAWLALILGILSPLTCGATGPFAVLFGYLALRHANLSDGQVLGARPAWAGMLLGAFGIILFAGGLFVVGLGHLRDESRLTVCTNNLRRMGLAVNYYASTRPSPHDFPPGTIPNPDLAPEKRLSWMVAILPYMETEPGPGPDTPRPPGAFQKGRGLADRFDLTKGWEANDNRQAMMGVPRWFECPSGSSRTDAGGPPWTEYVGLAGLGVEAPTWPASHPDAGFFGYDRIITRTDVKRGTAQTMMVTERRGVIGPWGAGGPATVTGVDPEKQPYVPNSSAACTRTGRTPSLWMATWPLSATAPRRDCGRRSAASMSMNEFSRRLRAALAAPPGGGG